MFLSATLKWLKLPFVRTVATKSEKWRMRKKLSVRRQDVEGKPTYKFNRSKQMDRRVYVWGMAQTGALGLNQSLNDQKLANIVRYPTRQSFAERFQVLDVAAGYGFTLFACKRERDDITLFGSGLNMDSQLGYHKLGGEHHTPMQLLIYPAPIALPKERDDENTDIVKCAAGRAHSLALSAENVLFTLGNNSLGQCGRPIVENEDYVGNRMVHRTDGKVLCGNGDIIEDLVCGLDHSLLRTKNGRVFSCGWGADGQTGLGHFQSTDHWCEIAGDIKGERIVKVASKYDCVLALNDKGEVFGWGNNEYNQLRTSTGDQHRMQQHTPIHLKQLKQCGKIVDVACGGSSCIALNENGEVFVWGFGLLGLGPKVEQCEKPTKVPDTLFGRNDFNPNNRVLSVYAGFSHFGAVTNSNTLYMWGENRSACLGVRHENNQYFPLQVGIGGMVEKIDCGVDHTVAYCKPFV